MLAYDDQGAGPPLVFLPGITCSMAHWGPVSDLLKSEFRCVRIDPPGHGASEGPGADVFGQTAAINEVVGHLGLGRPMMVGHSAGGVTALVYALLHPAAGVVVVDQPLDVAEWGSDVVAMKDRLLDPATFRDAFFEFIARFRGDLVPEERQALLTDHIDPRYEVVMAMWEPFLTGDAHDATAQLATALPDLAVPPRHLRRRIVVP